MSGAAARMREVVWVREARRPGIDPTRRKGVGSAGMEGLRSLGAGGSAARGGERGEGVDGLGSERQESAGIAQAGAAQGQAGQRREGAGGAQDGAVQGHAGQRKARAALRSAVRVPDASLGFYRRYTEVFLRRYMQLSLRMGQVPSVLGSCMFRGRVSSRRTKTFEDTVALVLDVEKCMGKLTMEDRDVIARVALQEYTQEEAAELLGMSHRTLVRRYAEAMDALTRILLDVELLEVESLYPGQ